MFKFRFSLLAIMLFVTMAPLKADDQQKNSGSFDIKKVRSAIMEQSDTALSGNSYLNSEKSENYAFVILRISLYLLLVIGLIFVVAWFFKRCGLSGGAKIGSSGAMDILEILPLGQNRNVLLVRVMDTVYLLGQTQSNIVLIEKIENKKAIELITSSKEGGSVMQFKDAFNNFIEKIKKPV